jgi:Ca2+/Na+ antiporter
MGVSRRIRAVLVTAAVWGAAWFVPGLVWIGRLEMHRSDGLPFQFLSVVQWAFLNWAVIGAIGGTLFALTLGLAERRRASLDALSMRRVVSWGAIGGAAFPLLVIPLVPIVAPEYARQLPAIHDLSAAIRQAFLAGAVYGVLGALSAGASLRLARRADPDLLSASDDLSLMPAGHLTNVEDGAHSAHSRI